MTAAAPVPPALRALVGRYDPEAFDVGERRARIRVQDAAGPVWDLDPRGRAAFSAAARSIHLEEPHGEAAPGRAPAVARPPSLFVWGRKDPLVPIAFADHVRRDLAPPA